TFFAWKSLSFLDASLPAAEPAATPFTSTKAIFESCGNGAGGTGAGGVAFGTAGAWAAGGVCGFGAPAGGAVCANEGAASAAIRTAARIDDFSTLIGIEP